MRQATVQSNKNNNFESENLVTSSRGSNSWRSLNLPHYVLSVMIQNSRHYLGECEKFKTLSPDQKKRTVVAAGRCLNCLSLGHVMRNCLVLSKCRRCGPRVNNKHAGPLHECFSRLRSVAGGAAEPACAKEDVKGTPHQDNYVQLVSLKAKSINHNVLLRTSAVRVIKPRTGKSTLAYAQHDTASQATLVSKRLIEELELDINTDYNLTIRTLADQTTVSKGLVAFSLQSLTSNEYFDVKDAPS